MEDKIITRLFIYLQHKGIPHTRFEKEIGLSNGYLNTQLKRNSDLGESVIRKIVDNCLDIDMIWLITGRGTMLKSSQSSTANQAASPTNNTLITEMKDRITELKDRIVELKDTIATKDELIAIIREQLRRKQWQDTQQGAPDADTAVAG